MRQRLRYALIRFLWLDVSGTTLLEPPSGMELGAVTADMVSPRPTSWAVLDDGDSELAKALGLSDIHVLMRCTELSKLLQRQH